MMAFDFDAAESELAQKKTEPKGFDFDSAEREFFDSSAGQADVYQEEMSRRAGSKPETEEQAAKEPERGFWNNQLRGIGAAGSRVAGELVEGIAALDAVAPRGVVPGAPSYAAPMVNAQRDFERSMSDEEFKQHKAEGYQAANEISDQIKSNNFGYDQNRNSVEKTKELFGKGNWLAGSMTVPGMLTDQLTQSIPYMLSAPITAVAIGGNTVRERVNNTDGKVAPDANDVAIGGVVGAASGVLERILPRMLFRQGKEITQAEAREIAESATKYAMSKIGKEALKDASVEGVTEVIQSGVLEYVGQRYGTDKAMSLQEAAMQGLEGFLIGGGIGGGLGAGRGAYDAQRDIRGASSLAGDSEVDLPQNGEEIGGGIVDDLPQENSETLQLDHNPQRMVVMPDGTTAWENEIADMPDIAGMQHPGYARLTETPDEIEQSLTGDVDIDNELAELMADLDRAESIARENFSQTTGAENAKAGIETGASWAEIHSGVPNLADNEAALPQPEEQALSTLRSERNSGLPEMAQQLSGIPDGRGDAAIARTDVREIGQRQGLRAGERDLGNTEGASAEPQEQFVSGIPGGEEADGGVGGAIEHPLQAIEAENSGLRMGARESINSTSAFPQEEQQNANVQWPDKTNERLGEGAWNQLQHSHKPDKRAGVERGEGVNSTVIESSSEAIDTAANEAATSPLNDLPEPTEAQKKAGNYKLGRVKLHGFDIAIENPRGSIRSGVDPDGKAWTVSMHNHYGYIQKTEASDGDAIDVFVGPNPESEKVFVVDQVNKDGSFDEVKVLFGFDSKLKARSGYKSNYSNGWKVGPITSMSMGEFKDWVKNGDTTKPLSGHFAETSKKMDSQAVGGQPDQEPRPSAKASASDTAKMSVEEIKSEINSLSEISEQRAQEEFERNGESRPPVPKSGFEYLNSAERERMHELKQALPSYGEERESAKSRLAERVAARKAKSAETNKTVEKLSSAEILTDSRSKYINKMARERGLKKDSPGYVAAMEKVEAEYETELDKAYAALPFEEFNRLNSDSPESVNKAAWESLREEYSGDTRYSLGDQKQSSGLDKESVQSVIDRIKKSWKNPHIKIEAVENIDGMPEPIKARILADKVPNEKVKAVYHNGAVYVNASAMVDALDVERAVFHEVHGHYGARALFGKDTSLAMGRLYLAIGGEKGIRDIAKKHSFDLSKYEKILKGESPGKRAEILADELLAHIAQDSKPSIKRWLQELIGTIRTWLRAHGFTGLGKFSDSEIMALLKRTREAATELKLDDGSVLRVLLDVAESSATADTTQAAYSLSGLPPKTRKVIGNDPVLATWTLLAQQDEAFQLPVSEKKTLEEIFDEVAPGVKIRRATEFDDNGAQVWAINPKKDTLALVFQKGKSVWIDVADYSPGQGGRQIYNAVANYAYNTGKTFIGDPAGLSDEAMARRLENMISSALKFGTTDHLWPHERQEQGGAGIPPIKWKAGDDTHNLKEMINASYQSVLNQFPEIADLRYNPVTDQIEGAKDGKVYSPGAIKAIAARKRDSGTSGGQPVTAGGTTLERAVLTHTVSRGTRQEQFNVLAALSNQRSERLAGILYSLAPDTEPETRPSGGFSVSGGSKDQIIQRGLDALGGVNSDWKNKAKRIIKDMVAPMGNLPDFAKALKIARDGKLNSDDMEIQFVMKDFEDKVFEVYHKNYRDLRASTRKEINDYLKGDRTNVKLTKQTVDMLNTLRNHITSMSGRLAQSYMRDIDQLQAEAAGAKGAELARIEAAIEVLSRRVDTICMNVDTYLHRSYRAFDDKNWPKKLKKDHPDVYKNAIEFLARQIAGDKPLTDEHYEAATQKADLILHEGTAYGNFVSFISEGKLGAKDLGITKQRKAVPPEIRALLGEYEDPALNYAKSVIKMSRLIHNSEFLQAFKKSGIEMGILFTEESRALGATAKVAGDNTEVYSPLNGLYTFPEVLKSLHDATNQSPEPEWLKKVVLVSGAIKYGKTVLAPTTAMRNIISASNFVIGNGHFNLTHAEKAWRVTKTYFDRKNHSGSRDYIKKMLSLGVLYDSPNVRELQDFINRIDQADYLGSGFAKGFKRLVLDNAQTFYAIGDDFWKIIGFENEKTALIEHHRMSEAEAETEAAKRIRNTYPTYSLVGRGVRNLGRYPILSAFPSFTSEVIRTTYHRVNYIIQDGKKLGFNNPHVLKKVAGFMLQASISYALAAATAAIFGISDEEDEAIRDGLPEWSKNSALIITGRDEKGNVTYYDIGWMDPYSYFKKPISALMRDDDIGNTMQDAAHELVAPFASLDILPSAISKYVENLLNPNKPATESTHKFLLNIAPGVVTNFENFIHAFTNHTDDNGKVYRESDELLALIGIRRSALDTKVSLTYRAYEYKDDKQRASASFRKKSQSLSDISMDDLKSAYDDMIEEQGDAWKKMQRSVRLSMTAGLDRQKAIDALTIAGVSKVDARRLADGLEFKFVPPARQAKLLYRKAAMQEEAEIKERLEERYKFLRELYRSN